MQMSEKIQLLTGNSISGESLEKMNANSYAYGALSDVRSGGLEHELSTLLEMDPSSDGDQPKSGNLSGLAKREMIRRHNDVAEADKLAMDADKALEEGNFELANDNYKSALNKI